MKTLDIVRDAVKDWIGNEEKENSRATIGINDEVMEDCTIACQLLTWDK